MRGFGVQRGRGRRSEEAELLALHDGLREVVLVRGGELLRPRVGVEEERLDQTVPRPTAKEL